MKFRVNFFICLLVANSSYGNFLLKDKQIKNESVASTFKKEMKSSASRVPNHKAIQDFFCLNQNTFDLSYNHIIDTFGFLQLMTDNRLSYPLMQKLASKYTNTKTIRLPYILSNNFDSVQLTYFNLWVDTINIYKTPKFDSIVSQKIERIKNEENKFAAYFQLLDFRLKNNLLRKENYEFILDSIYKENRLNPSFLATYGFHLFENNDYSGAKHLYLSYLLYKDKGNLEAADNVLRSLILYNGGFNAQYYHEGLGLASQLTSSQSNIVLYKCFVLNSNWHKRNPSLDLQNHLLVEDLITAFCSKDTLDVEANIHLELTLHKYLMYYYSSTNNAAIYNYTTNCRNRLTKKIYPHRLLSHIYMTLTYNFAMYRATLLNSNLVVDYYNSYFVLIDTANVTNTQFYSATMYSMFVFYHQNKMHKEALNVYNQYKNYLEKNIGNCQGDALFIANFTAIQAMLSQFTANDIIQYKVFRQENELSLSNLQNHIKSATIDFEIIKSEKQKELYTIVILSCIIILFLMALYSIWRDNRNRKKYYEAKSKSYGVLLNLHNIRGIENGNIMSFNLLENLKNNKNVNDDMIHKAETIYKLLDLTKQYFMRLYTNQQEQLISINEEIKVAELYFNTIVVQKEATTKFRYFPIDSEKSIMLPPNIIHAFIENSFKSTTSDFKANGIFEIESIKRIDRQFAVRISNNCLKSNHHSSSEKVVKEGHALYYIKELLDATSQISKFSFKFDGVLHIDKDSDKAYFEIIINERKNCKYSFN